MSSVKTYTSTLNSFKLFFRCDMGCIIRTDIKGKMIWRPRNFSRNVIFRWIRSIFTWGFLSHLQQSCGMQAWQKTQSLFKNVYTGIGKTVKRAISLSDIENIKSIQLAEHKMIFMRDMFMFSFLYTGMSFCGHGLSEKGNLKTAYWLTGGRRQGKSWKSNGKNVLRDIVDRNPSLDGGHLLPIIDSDAGDETEPIQKTNSTCWTKALKSLSQRQN